MSDGQRVLSGVRLIGGRWAFGAQLACRRGRVGLTGPGAQGGAGALGGPPGGGLRWCDQGADASLQAPAGPARAVLFGPAPSGSREDGRDCGEHSERRPASPLATPGASRQLEAGPTALLPAAAAWQPIGALRGVSFGQRRFQLPLLCCPQSDRGVVAGATGHYRNGVLLAAVTAEADHRPA